MATMTESWKPVPEFPGYDVSDQGRVRSYWGYSHVTDKVQRYLSPWHGRYLRVMLQRDRHQHQHSVSRLALLAFVGPCPDGKVACHNNDDPHDNRLENLRYDTQKGNLADVPQARRYENCNRKLSDKQVVQIRERYAADMKLTHTYLAIEYNVQQGTIQRICTGKSFPYLGGPITKTIDGVTKISHPKEPHGLHGN